MLKRWLRCLPAGLILAALVMALVWLTLPRSFADVAGLGERSELYVHTWDAEAPHEVRESQPEPEAAESLLALLKSGSVRLKGFRRTIYWEKDQSLYHLQLHAYSAEGEWQGATHLALRSDGMLYKTAGEWGYLWYELSGCDMNAVLAELEALPGMA